MVSRVAVTVTLAALVVAGVLLLAQHRHSSAVHPTAEAQRQSEPARCFRPAQTGPFPQPQPPGHGCSPCLASSPTSPRVLVDEAHFTVFSPPGALRSARLGWACGGRQPDAPIAIQYANHIDVVVGPAPVGQSLVARKDATVLGVPAHAAPRPADGLNSIVELYVRRSEIVVSDDGSHPLSEVVAFANSLVALPHYYRLFPWAW